MFGFAGAYRWTLIPLTAGTLVLAFVSPPRLGRPHRVVDAALLACLLVTALQLVPLSPSLRLTLSPAAGRTDQALFLNAQVDPLAGPLRPLSMDAPSTAWALVLAATLLVIFWCARSSFERAGGLRDVPRTVAWFGLALAAVVFVQRVLSPDLIYGFWRPIARIGHPHPIGPFLNRNDLATWLIIAIPVVLSYALARIESRRRQSERPMDLESIVDPRMVVLAVSLCLMVATLLASLSRSGLVAGAVGLIALMTFVSRRMSRGGIRWTIAAVTAIVMIATMYVSTAAIASRVGTVFSTQLGGRLAVWRETWPIARDFPWVGVGVGAFERAMSVYQQSTHLMFINHAHNEYLQWLTEGGLALVLPAGIAIGAVVVRIAGGLAEDSSAMFMVRAGAVSALAAVAVQSIWDTGLRLPANSVLCAIAAAIALHDRQQGSGGSAIRQGTAAPVRPQEQ